VINRPEHPASSESVAPPQLISAGSWVEVQLTLLEAGQRAAGIPSDTAATPLMMRVRGHLVADVNRLGDTATVRTLTGRNVTGELVQSRPRHAHDFGRTDPDVLASGLRLRELAKQPPEPS